MLMEKVITDDLLFRRELKLRVKTGTATKMWPGKK